MKETFNSDIKERGYKSLLQEHDYNIDAVMDYIKLKKYYSPNSKIANVKNELIRIKNQKTVQSNYYKDNLYLLTEIRTKINQVESKSVTIPTIVY